MCGVCVLMWKNVAFFCLCLFFFVGVVEGGEHSEKR